MYRLSAGKMKVLLGLLTAALLAVFAPSHAAAPLPDPTLDAPASTAKGAQTAVFAGG